MSGTLQTEINNDSTMVSAYVSKIVSTSTRRVGGPMAIAHPGRYSSLCRSSVSGCDGIAYAKETERLDVLANRLEETIAKVRVWGLYRQGGTWNDTGRRRCEYAGVIT